MKKITLMVLSALVIMATVLYGAGKQEEEKVEGKIGGSVSFICTGGTHELEAYQKAFDTFEAETGIKVEMEATRDMDALVTARVEGGIPPNIVAFPGWGGMIKYGNKGNLVDLGTILEEDVKKSYNPDLLKQGQVDGKQVGIMCLSSLMGLIWYNPKSIKAAGITIPKTWDEANAIDAKLASEGKNLWANGNESGAASGWPGCDWVEYFLLKMYGTEKYKDFYEGKLAWTSPEVKKSWEMYGEVIERSYGGNKYVLSTNFGNAIQPVFSDPPKAYFHHQASFVTGFIKDQFPDLKPVEDYNFFAFPSVNPKYAKAIIGTGNTFVMFNDTPQARAFINFLAGPEFQSKVVPITGHIAPNKKVSLSIYTDEITRSCAKIYQEAEMISPAGSVLLPTEMGQAYWKAIVDYVDKPDNLDSILERMDKMRQEFY